MGLCFYNRRTHQCAFYQVKGFLDNRKLPQLTPKNAPTLTLNYQVSHFLSGNFGGPTRYNDFLCYSKEEGRCNLFASDENGTVTTIMDTGPWEAGWTSITPGRFGGEGPYTDLLCYQASTGRYKVFEIDATGKPKEHPRQGQWRTDWNLMVSGHFGGKTGLSDLCSYKTDTGDIDLDQISAGGSSLTYTNMIRFKEKPQTWTHLIAAPFSGKATDDFLFYSRTTGEVAIYSIQLSEGKIRPGKVLFANEKDTYPVGPGAEVVLLSKTDDQGSQSYPYLLFYYPSLQGKPRGLFYEVRVNDRNAVMQKLAEPDWQSWDTITHWGPR